MANQVWNRLSQMTSNYKNSQQAPSLNNNQYSSYYSKLYPGLNEESYNKMVNAVDGLGLTGQNRTNAMNNYYRTHVKTLINDQTLQERDDIINQQAYEAAKINNKDADAELRMTEAVQKAKKLWNLDATADDREVFSTMVETLGADGTKLAGQYLSGENNEFLKATGLDDNKANQLDNDSYAKIEGKINGALKGDWGKLSTNGLKYVQGWKLILDATELAKAKGATGMNDGEIMRNVIKSSPKLQQKIAELQTIQKGLTDSDKSVLKGETNGVTVGRSGFSILPGISLQLGDDAGMNISLVNDKPASYKDIQDLIDVKEKFGDNYVGEVGNVAKVFANQPIDTLKKKGNQILNEFDNIGTNMENFWNNIMPKQIVEAMQGREMTDDELEQYKQNVAAEYDARKNKNKEQVLKYNDKINKAFQKQVEQNLDPQIKEYYDDKTITELLALGDMQGVGYKQAQMMASNWDMLPNIVVTAVNTPAGLTMMFGDSYARESQDSFERLMNAGADYDQASGISKVVGVINGAVEVGLDRLLGGVETTASKNLKNAFMNNLTEEATKKGFWEILGNIAKKQAGSSLEEGAEEVIQEIVSNAAEMTIKDNPEFADLFKGTWEAFEGGVFNPMNLMAGGSDIAANKGNIQQSLLDASYDAGVTARNIVDAGSNMQNNVREFMLDGAYNAGKGARNIVEWADKVKEFMSRKKNQNQTTNNVEVETTAIPQGTETTVDNSVTETNNKGDKATLKEELYSIDPTLKKNLQNNPYSAEVWQKTKDYIDKNGRPERSNDVAKALIEDVADRVQAKLMEKMDEGGETGKLYKPLKEAGFTVDLTELKNGIDEMLEGFGIEIEDGKLNFDKTAIDGSEASNIRKIYNWLQTTNAPMGITEYLERFRRTLTDMVDFNPNGRDQAGRKVADTPGDKVLKKIRTKANDLAHNQISELAELDKEFNEWVKVMDEVSDGLVYKDKTKKGVIRDNITQIIKNLDEPTRRQLANRLEKIMPGIREEVNAINQMPKVIDHYYNPSKLQQGLTSEGLKAFGSLGGLPGYLLTRWGGAKISEKIDSFKSKAWDEVLQETSEEGKAKMQEIQAKIEENKRLTKEQEARLQGLKDRLLEKMATMDKTDAEQSAWNNWLADLEQDEVIDMPEEVYDQWEEVTTTPKKKTTKKTSKKETSKNQTKNNVKLDTKKIASDYMKGEMDWNKYQHLAGLTEEQALEKRGKFQAAIDEEWDKNQDYYNTHQSELVDKFHHLLK